MGNIDHLIQRIHASLSNFSIELCFSSPLICQIPMILTAKLYGKRSIPPWKLSLTIRMTDTCLTTMLASLVNTFFWSIQLILKNIEPTLSRKHTIYHNSVSKQNKAQYRHNNLALPQRALNKLPPEFLTRRPQALTFTWIP